MISEISRGYELNGTRGGSPRLKAFSTSLPFSLQFSKSLNWNSFNFLFNFLLKTPPGIAPPRWMVDWGMTVRRIILFLSHSVGHLRALLWHNYSWNIKQKSKKSNVLSEILDYDTHISHCIYKHRDLHIITLMLWCRKMLLQCYCYSFSSCCKVNIRRKQN